MNHELGINDGELKAKNFLLDHHAYAVSGEGNIANKLFEIIEKSWGVIKTGNPDFFYKKFESLGVDDAREIKSYQEKRAFESGSRKILIIDANSITNEAQNSLLKIFEEPVKNTYFFVLGNCVRNLLPTLRSRLATLKTEGAPPVLGKSGGAGHTFLSLAVPKRLELIKKLSDDIKDEKKSKSDAIVLLDEIEQFFYSKFKKGNLIPDKLLANIEICRNYLNDPSASVKMILEYVALITPKIGN